MELTSSHARAVINAAESVASRIGVAVTIAVVDAGVNLKAFNRMDDAVLGSIDIAIGKARTAALFASNSENIWDYCKPGGTSPGLENTNNGLVPFAGGVPLKTATGTLVGAVGVSGGAVAQDMDIAQAAAAAFSG